ncbi:DUF4238 domain-containing protein [Mycoplasmatota bacterium zrk1]
MEYKFNHFVPKLILRKFSRNENMYYFDVENQELKHGKIDKIFGKDFLYRKEGDENSKELENKFNTLLEGKIKKLIAEEILGRDEVTLRRSQLLFLKKYMLLQLLRIPTPEDVSLKKMNTNYKKFILEFFESGVMKERSFDDFDSMSDNEIFLSDIEIVLETDFDKLLEHPNISYIVYNFCCLINFSYLGFVASNDENEFIINDSGLTSETDFITYKDEIMRAKEVFHIKNMMEGRGVNPALLLRNSIFHENFYMFPISKEVTVLLINPFFKEMQNKTSLEHKHKEDYIFTSGLKFSRFEKNLVVYDSDELQDCYDKEQQVFVDPPRGYEKLFTKDDEFTYKLHRLSSKEIVYLNSLMFNETQRIVGFNDYAKIKKSICTYMRGDLRKANLNFLSLNSLFVNRKDHIRVLISDFNQLKISDEIDYNNRFEVKLVRFFNSYTNNHYDVSILLDYFHSKVVALVEILFERVPNKYSDSLKPQVITLMSNQKEKFIKIINNIFKESLDFNNRYERLLKIFDFVYDEHHYSKDTYTEDAKEHVNYLISPIKDNLESNVLYRNEILKKIENVSKKKYSINNIDLMNVLSDLMSVNKQSSEFTFKIYSNEDTAILETFENVEKSNRLDEGVQTEFKKLIAEEKGLDMIVRNVLSDIDVNAYHSPHPDFNVEMLLNYFTNDNRLTNVMFCSNLVKSYINSLNTYYNPVIKRKYSSITKYIINNITTYLRLEFNKDEKFEDIYKAMLYQFDKFDEDENPNEELDKVLELMQKTKGL